MEKELNNDFYIEIKNLLEKYEAIKPAVIINFKGSTPFQAMIDDREVYDKYGNVSHVIGSPSTGAKHEETAIVLGVKNWFSGRGSDDEGRLRWLMNTINQRFYPLMHTYIDNTGGFSDW